MGASLRVLLVEDDESDALQIVRSLREAGFEPDAERVTNESGLVEALQQSSWDIVLSDYSISGINAVGAVFLVRQLAPEIPFILVSGTVGEDAAAAVLKCGADDFVLKSNLSRLGPAVRRGLREAETRRAWRRAEKELRDSEARFRSLVENVNDIILILTPAGIVRYQSPSVERVLGYLPEEFSGRNVLDFVHPEDVPAVRAALARPLGGPRPSTPPECRMRHRDGAWRILEGVMTNLSHDPAVGGIVCNARDITDRKRTEAERHRVQRLESLGSLASGIAHDLNNLLTPILVASDMLREDLPAGERETLLDGLLASAGRASDIVRHLLSFARGMAPGRASIDPATLVRDLERLLRVGLPKAIRQRFLIPDGLWHIAGDPSELLRVLMNLCVNARDAMPAGGVLTVEAANVVLHDQDVRFRPQTRPGPYVHLRVTDSGSGILPDVKDRIFEPFFTTKQEERGTGLGLSTSLNIVQEHGGLITVYSEPGRGTRFSVYLPAAVTEAARRGRDLPRGGGEWILVVDDEASVREVVRETLEVYGYRTATAGNGAEALAIHARYEGRINLAIVDVAMPMVDGPTTVRALRKAEPGLRILIQGGFVHDSRGEFPDDVAGFLEKPYTTEVLLREVARALDRDDREDRRGRIDAYTADHRR